MTGIISTLAATLLESGKSPVRISQVTGIGLYAEKTNPPRVTAEAAISLYSDRSYPVRVTYFTGYALTSIADSPVVDIPRPTLLQREANPYKPTTPDEIDDLNPTLYDYLREQTATIRAQHNVTQAGDSTFPWELLTKIGPERQFTLGSLGRFYHDDYGIILARYVQFDSMRQSAWLNGPVGFVNDSDRVHWRVTNDPNLSSLDLIVGVLGSFTQPTDGWYGWVLTQGANHAPLRVDVDKPIKADSQLVWGGFDLVSATGKGVVLGRTRADSVQASKSEAYLPTGSVFLGLEGPSIESLAALLGDHFEDIREDLKEINRVLDLVGGGQLAETIESINQTLTLNEDRLKKLETGLDFAAIRRRLDKLETFDAAGLETRVLDAVDQKNSGLLAQVQAIKESLSGYGDLATDLAEIQKVLGLLQAQFNTVVQDAEAVYYPLVDGGIPPQLVYLPNGELVLVKGRL